MILMQLIGTVTLLMLWLIGMIHFSYNGEGCMLPFWAIFFSPLLLSVVLYLTEVL